MNRSVRVGPSLWERTGAAAALLVVLVGFPLVMFQLVGWPLPDQLPTVDSLRQAVTEQLSARTIVNVLAVGAWLAWAHFVVCLLVELRAAFTGRARRVPFGGVNQQLAGKLVASLLLSVTVSAATGITPATATAAYAAPAASSSTVSQSADVAAPAVTVTPAPVGSQVTPAAQDDGHPSYTVQPRQQGYADNLWDISERYLGDGTRWQEIFTLNEGREQPDGAQLREAGLLRPGWQLLMPSDATDLPLAAEADRVAQEPTGSVTVQPGDTLWDIAQERLGDGQRYTEIADATTGVQPDGRQLSNPDLILPGWQLTVPGVDQVALSDAAPEPAPADQATPGPAAATVSPAEPVPAAVPAREPMTPTADEAPATPLEPTAPAAGADVDETAEDDDTDAAVPVRTAAGVGALLAAGVLMLLASRRTAQQGRRRPGRTLPLPTGQSAAVEQELRATADPMSVQTVDVALRSLAAACAKDGVPLPVVRAARLTAEQFELYLTHDAQLPAPWTATRDRAVWALPSIAGGLLGAQEASEIAAPYPSLVTIGHDEENGHVLLDLERVGSLGITGDTDVTRQVLAAIAVELATSHWADDLQVTLVGDYPELGDALGTGRVRYVPAIGHLLEELTRRAEQDRNILTKMGVPDLHHARVADVAQDIWTPEIVLLAGQATDDQREQLRVLVEQLPRVAIAAVTSGTPLGEWSLRLNDHGAVLEPIGLTLQPQRIDDQTYGQMLEVLAVAEEDDESVSAAPELPEPTLTDLGRAGKRGPRIHLIDGAAAEFGAAGSVRVHLSAVDDATASSAGGGGAEGLADGAAGEDAAAPDPSLAAEAPQEPIAASESPSAAVADAQQPETPAEPVELVEPVGQAAQANDDLDESAPPAVIDLRDEAQTRGHGEAEPVGPRVLVLGPVVLVGTRGQLPQASHAARYTELAAFLSLNPDSETKTIRDAYFVGGQRRPATAVHQAISRLRRWLGDDSFLPKNPAGGRYRLGEAVTNDWLDWQQLLPNGATAAPSEALEAALKLVRQRPFHGVDAHYYAWAEHTAQRMVAAIVDAAHELARRRLMEGRYQAVLEATAVGLLVEPVVERLWRLRLLAARASGNETLEEHTIEQLYAATEDFGPLEQETEQLLLELRDPKAARAAAIAAQMLR